MYATPDYLQGLGELKGPADLARAEFIAFDRTDRYRDHLASLGIVTTRSNFPILTANHLVQWQLARQGLGICMVMEEVGDPDPRVVRVLNGEPSVPVPMWLTSHRELRTSRRIRVVFDLLAEALG